MDILVGKARKSRKHEDMSCANYNQVYTQLESIRRISGAVDDKRAAECGRRQRLVSRSQT